MPRYHDRREPSNHTPIIVGVVVLLVCGIGTAAFLATRNTEASKDTQVRGEAAPKIDPKPELESEPKAQPRPVPKSEPNRTQQPPPKLPTASPKPPDKNAWKAEAKLEYLDALQRKERRMSEAQIRLGMMGEGEFRNATRALKFLNDYGIEKASPIILADAARIAPHYVESAQRERQMKTGEYAKLVKAGLRPDRYPVEKRKELYKEFARAVGSSSEWSLASWFDDLTAEEMDEAMVAVRQLASGGLGKLTKQQRLLLLKAEALELFERELGR